MAQFNYNEFEKLNAFYDKVLYECIDEVNSIYFVDGLNIYNSKFILIMCESIVYFCI